MVQRIDGVLVVHEPTGEPAPAVFDSPHSGTRYPADFDTVLPTATVRATEDMYVDELYGAAPQYGAPLLAALFPRIYIDPNRSALDIDPGMLEGEWPEPLKPGEKSIKLGAGLIWKTCDPNQMIYNRKLKVAEVQNRIARYWRPYHEKVKALLDDSVRRFGGVWHIDCHSMQALSTSKSPEGVAGIERPDFILGNRYGTSCSPEFTDLVKTTLEGRGYSVGINNPFAGAELTLAYSNPAQNRHSLQIEVKRRLYMGEKTFEKAPGFAKLQSDLSHLIATVCDYARAQVKKR